MQSMQKAGMCMIFFYRYKPFIITFLLMFALSLVVVTTVTRYKITSDTRQMEFLAATKSNEIIEAIYALLYKAEALATLVIQGNGTIHEFERIAPIIINSPVIRNILLAPGGVVSRVHPTAGNERLMGFDMLGPGDGNREAILARDTQKLTLGGPFTAMQGGQVLVGRLPVFTSPNGERTFWGLVSVTLSYPEALQAVRLGDLDNLGFACEIWRINPDQQAKQIILQTRNAPLHNPLEKSFQLLNANWIISLSPLYPWYQQYSLYVMLAAALLFSALIAAIAQNYCEMREVRASLERMARYDALTGLPNRRAAFEHLEQALANGHENGAPFTLAYLDLNDFKAINDTCGHHIGDVVLKETAERITASLPEGQFAARIGGDEFLIILRNVDGSGTTRVLAALREAMTLPFARDLAEGLHTSLSIGMSSFPEHGTNAEELTAHADTAMYVDKEHARSRRRRSRNDMTAIAHTAGVRVVA